MIVLDLYSEVMPQYLRLKSYFGQPFIWCMLHNFGGTLSMYGALQSVNKVMNCYQQSHIVEDISNPDMLPIYAADELWLMPATTQLVCPVDILPLSHHGRRWSHNHLLTGNDVPTVFKLFVYHWSDSASLHNGCKVPLQRFCDTIVLIIRFW